MRLQLSRSRSDALPGWLTDALTERLADISKALEPADADVELVVVDDAFMRDLNSRFRGRDEPTDVISFSYLEGDERAVDEALSGEVYVAGEVYISRETLERDAGELGVDVADHFLRIGVHGLLHVIGHDHETDRDAERMEAEERRVLSTHVPPDRLDALFR